MNWPIAKISTFCVTGSGGTPLREQSDFYFGGQIPWVKSGELKDDVLLETGESITTLGLEQSAAKIVPAGSILIAMYGATVGRTALLGIEAATNQAVCSIQPNSKIADTRFVWYYLRSKLSELLRRRVGGAQPNISQQIIKSLEVTVPPLSEQKRIVALLDQASDLHKARATANTRFRHIRPALFYTTFGDPATNPMGWRSTKLGEVILDTQYGTSIKAADDDGGTPVIRMNNIDSNGYMNLEKLKYVSLPEGDLVRLRLEKGDILFNRTNSKELVGKTGLWRGEMTAVAASYLIRARINPEMAKPEYVWTYLNTPFMKDVLFNKARRAIGMANINAEELRALPIMLPDTTKQEIFSRQLRALDEVRETVQRADKKLEVLYSTFLQRAFTGELTCKWRQERMTELIEEMKQQAKDMGISWEYQLC